MWKSCLIGRYRKGLGEGGILNRCWCVDINLMLDLQYMTRVIGNVLRESLLGTAKRCKLRMPAEGVLM